MVKQSLVNEVASLLPPEGLTILSRATKESEPQLRDGLGAVIPTILATLLLHSKEPGTNTIERIISSVADLCVLFGSPAAKPRPWRDAPKTVQWDELLKQPERMLGELSVPGTPATSMASQLLNQLFGAEWSKVLRALTAHTQIAPSSLMALTTMAIPMVVAWLSNRINAAGGSLTPASLGAELTKLAPELRTALPMHLAPLLAPADLLTTGGAPAIGSRPAREAAAVVPGTVPRGSDSSSFFTPSSQFLTSFLSLLLLLSIARVFYPWRAESFDLRPHLTQVQSTLSAKWPPVAIALRRLTGDAKGVFQSVQVALQGPSATRNAAEDTRADEATLTALNQSEENTGSIRIGDNGETPDIDIRAMLRQIPGALTTPTAVVPIPKVEPVTDNLGSAALPARDTTNPSTMILLPDGSALSSPLGLAEQQLLAFIRGGVPARKGGTWYVLETVSFDSAKSTLSPAGQLQIANVGKILRAYPSVTVSIAGHTDSEGLPSTNLSLSEQRASVIKKLLIASGVDGIRITSEGFGSTQPVATNATPEGRAANRRIAVQVVTK